MYTWKAQMAELETKDTMAVQAAEHIATIWGIDETSEFLACNEGDEVLFIATTINSWTARSMRTWTKRTCRKHRDCWHGHRPSPQRPDRTHKQAQEQI